MLVLVLVLGMRQEGRRKEERGRRKEEGGRRKGGKVERIEFRMSGVARHVMAPPTPKMTDEGNTG